MAKKNQETEVKSVNQIKVHNEELYQELTNKNEQYIFQLSARLDEMGYDKVAKEYVLNEMLQEIVEAQKSHITARKIYGTVTAQANNIAEKEIDIAEAEQEKSPLWMLYLDGALLLGGLFTIVNGFAAYRDLSMNIGLFQIVLNYLLGGLAVLVLTKYAPQRGQMKGMFKYIAATVSVMLLWIVVMAFVLAFLPSAINPVIPPAIIIGLGFVSLLAKWYLKKELNIKGTLI